MIKPISIEELPMPKGIPSLLQPRGVYRCHFCEKTYKQHAALRRHYQTKHDYHIWKVSVIIFSFLLSQNFSNMLCRLCTFCVKMNEYSWKYRLFVKECKGSREMKLISREKKNWINYIWILYLLCFCVRFQLLSWFIDMNMWIEKMMEYCGMRKNFYLLQCSYYISAFWSDILVSKNLTWRNLILKAVKM